MDFTITVYLVLAFAVLHELRLILEVIARIMKR
jgi:hypothetical protein